MEVLNSLWCGANVVFGKECSILWRCAPILEFVIFLGGVGPNYEWLIVEFVTLNLFVGNSFGTPAILCIWWFWHWEG